MPNPPPSGSAKAATAKSQPPPSTASTSATSSPALAPRSASQSRTVASGGNSPIAASAVAVTLPPLPCGRRRLTSHAPWRMASSCVPSVEASSATISRAPGKRLGQGVQRRADPLHLILRRHDRDARRFRRHAATNVPRAWLT